MATVDFADIQGLVRFGHGKLKAAEFLLLETANVAAARQWLGAAQVTSAERQDTPPRTALQIAFTASGLRALGLEAEILAQFPEAFLGGMAGEANRSRRLGDMAGNDPANWYWGRPEPHAILMLYAEPGQLEELEQAVTGPLFAQAFRVVQVLPTSLSRSVEPFGFVDGVSQPEIDWEQKLTRPPRRPLPYSNVLALGEVVLGYANEYGEVSPRPLVRSGTPGADTLPVAADAPDWRDFGKNGTFLVLRQLHQDVHGFWSFLDGAADRDAQRREALAAAMVGRHRDGRTLMAADGSAAAVQAGNDFTYDGDPDGYICPVGAHIRRANPRTGDHPPEVGGAGSRLMSMLGFLRRRDRLPGRHDLVASTRFHRIVRRGREFGADMQPEAAQGAGAAQGLYFICLCANLVRQFEFIQNAWLSTAKFNGLFAEQDPLLGNRMAVNGEVRTDSFSRPRRLGVTERTEGLPPFVTVQGGAYFFLPSLRALRFLAAHDPQGEPP
ncbi:Dyp-type peroxidase [Rubellimicrobium arenae]|uniref:Dyp-type peroxidase n=1 Tax=Rubellimicrobium arenae TaxID=2817372 RepID=UPI001B309090|nr:hypothetical protein [Rubellimicrobium arenae]